MSQIDAGSVPALACLTPETLETTLAALDTGGSSASAVQLAERVRSWFGSEHLATGPDPRIDELMVARALEVPAQHRPDEPACVMVFQDGAGPKDYVPTVFDNLIAKGHMPVTAGVFIDPGVFAHGGRNRSFEYDTLSDQHARLLLEEILPEVEKTVRLRQDPQSRAISGLSSGGICAFTAAWERPGSFSKVLSWIGSFTNIAHGESGVAGGHNYPAMIRRTSRKPIRVFLQDRENDLNLAPGDWWLANLEMASALGHRRLRPRRGLGQGLPHPEARPRHPASLLALALARLPPVTGPRSLPAAHTEGGLLSYTPVGEPSSAAAGDDRRSRTSSRATS